MPLGSEIDRVLGHIVLDEDLAPASPRKEAKQPPALLGLQTRPMFIVGETDGWIKMLLGTNVSLGPCDIVLDGDPAAPERGTARLCGFLHISTSGFRVRDRRASFTHFAISRARDCVSRPLPSRLTLNTSR